jgi:hypothetical protein
MRFEKPAPARDTSPSDVYVQRSGDDDCAHDRVFSGGAYLTATPMWHFVCAKCPLVASRVFPDGSKPTNFDSERFEDRLRQTGWYNAMVTL